MTGCDEQRRGNVGSSETARAGSTSWRCVRSCVSVLRAVSKVRTLTRDETQTRVTRRRRDETETRQEGQSRVEVSRGEDRLDRSAWRGKGSSDRGSRSGETLERLEASGGSNERENHQAYPCWNCAGRGTNSRVFWNIVHPACIRHVQARALFSSS